ncbi:hypothetical protein [Nostoc sp. CMAA1605]|uniref:hypothetical protein n=1 Tax=Nostoc sp. CMAA1605 TaxID=2055159 RepID=UPI001F3A0A53|nr:hypothetical protein [Nostoc sp. CMAA1605]
MSHWISVKIFPTPLHPYTLTPLHPYTLTPLHPYTPTPLSFFLSYEPLPNGKA